MGTCIICGTSVDGRVCESHQEDVAFEFRGDRPEQLVSGRYYRGTVDGFADFGVFVDIGDSVTGLLHKSEVRGRLESLEWEPGDTVYVQVLGVHDNGNVDLGWSIRQSAREFRGRLVHDPGAEPPEYESDAGESASEVVRTGPSERPRGNGSESGKTETDTESEGGAPEPESEEVETEPEPDETEPESAEIEGEGEAAEPESAEVEAETESVETEPEAAELVAVADLDDHVGDRVRLEGEIVGVRQTGGPTVFDLADETGNVDCAAFVSAGERAYPEVEADAVVALVGVVERHRGELQVETEELTVLEGEDRAAVEERLESALDERARPDETEPLAEDEVVEGVLDDVVEAATAIRKAVIEGRPVVVRHPTTVDGYVAGAAIERATLPLVREVHAASDAEYHYFDRRPLDERFYTMDEATDDVTALLDAEARHGEKRPLFVFVDLGSTAESTDGFEFLDVYGARRVVVDDDEADEAVVETTDALVTTGGERTAAVAAANVAVHVSPAVRSDLAHLPSISYWSDAPAAYADLATESGHDAEALSDLREAIALEAYYQSYEPKRELVQDLLWSAENRALAADLSEQFREKLDAELDTADPHVEVREFGETAVAVLDADAHTHRFDFPPTGVLLDALHGSHGADVTVAVDETELYLRSDAPVDLRDVADGVAADLPEAGVRARGAREGKVEFLRGAREDVVDAVVAAAADRVGAATAQD
ncbi:MAG: OB-fold nucleic acid binding domain-containing protein [Halobacteriaceae archaeon]